MNIKCKPHRTGTLLCFVFWSAISNAKDCDIPCQAAVLYLSYSREMFEKQLLCMSVSVYFIVCVWCVLYLNIYIYACIHTYVYIYIYILYQYISGCITTRMSCINSPIFFLWCVHTFIYNV
jgi:hypothetical protein